MKQGNQKPPGARPSGTNEDEISLSTEDYVILSENSHTEVDDNEPYDPSVVDVSYLSAENQPDPYVGTTVIGRYEIQSLIGIGGMGRVYKAYQTTVDRYVALKILPAGPGLDSKLAKRFHQEARAASRLSHPNTITVHDFGQMEDGSLFIVMEYLSGQTLEYVIAERPSVARVLRIALQICGSLAEAHSKGIVHRDLKPPNIIVSAIGEDKDWVKVVDFGIAKLINTSVSLTIAGTVSGTPEYMSPEQVQGEKVDARSDIYSLGLLLYELLTGIPVVQCATPLACMYAHIHNSPPSISEASEDRSIPPGLERVVLKMISKNPKERFQSISRLMPVLNDILLEEVTRLKTAPRLQAEESTVEKARVSPEKKEMRQKKKAPTSKDELQILEELAKLYDRRGEPELATETYRKIAVRYIDNNAYEEATVVLKAALALSPNDEHARQMIETCFSILDQRRQKKAEEGDHRPSPVPPRPDAPKRSISDITAKKMLSTRLELAVQEGLYQEALSLIRKTLAEDPNNSVAFEYAGHIYETVEDNILDQDEIIWLKALLGKATDKASRQPVFADTETFNAELNLIRIDGGRLISAYGGTFEVAPFSIQKYPVTNGEYKAFIDATGELPPSHWLGRNPPANSIHVPVVGVTLRDARKYAEWRFLRLPTVVEWEAAARLPDGRVFPWGNTWTKTYCHCIENGATAPGEVGRYLSGASHYGCLDLLGNVWEWTENQDEMPSPEPGYFWVLGGSFRHPCVKNGHIARTDVSEHGAYPYLGFRCVGTDKRKRK